MSERTRMAKVLATVKSARTRAILSLGIVLGLTSVSTLAAWSDTAILSGGSIQSGKLDVLLNGSLQGPGGTLPVASFSLPHMIPGESVATTLTVGRAAGSVAFDYDIKAKLSATNALQGALRFKIYAGNNAAATGVTETNGVRQQGCTGTQIYGGAEGLPWSATEATLLTREELSTPALPVPTSTQEDKSTLR